MEKTRCKDSGNLQNYQIFNIRFGVSFHCLVVDERRLLIVNAHFGVARSYQARHLKCVHRVLKSIVCVST